MSELNRCAGQLQSGPAMALARQPSPSSQACLGSQRGPVAIPSRHFGVGLAAGEQSQGRFLKRTEVLRLRIYGTQASLCMRVCMHPATKEI